MGRLRHNRGRAWGGKHGGSLRNSRRLSECRPQLRRLVEDQGRRRVQGFQPASRRPGQGHRGAAGLPDRRRHARAHRLSKTGDRRAARSEAPDHDRHAQCLDRHRGGEGARRHGLRHRLVRQPDLRHRHRPDARTDPPYRLRERPHACRRGLADHHRSRSRRHDAGRSWPRQARHPHRQHRQGFRHEGDRLEPKSHGRKNAKRPASVMSARTICSASPISSPSTSCCRRAPAALSAPRNSG